jgi:hypothetical protein
VIPIHRTPSSASSPTSTNPLSNLTSDLASFDTAFSLYEYPAEWLVANTNDILMTIRESNIEQFEEGEKEECVRLTKKTVLYPVRELLFVLLLRC